MLVGLFGGRSYDQIIWSDHICTLLPLWLWTWICFVSSYVYSWGHGWSLAISSHVNLVFARYFDEMYVVIWFVHFASCFYIDIYCIMGCYYTLWHNTYANSLLFYKVYIKRENAGSWNSGLEKEQILETYSAQLQKSWNSTERLKRNKEKSMPKMKARGPTPCSRGCPLP